MAKDYNQTIHLPKTDFPMRAGLPKREPEMLRRWEELDLYNEQLKKNEGKPLFSLHDGPPFSNGDLHMGHALNKALKDFIIRSHAMRGYYTPYIPGWDNHGMPIESAIIKEQKLNRKAMELTDQGISLISVRNRSQNGENVRDLFGLVRVEDDRIQELVTPVWNWGNYYEQILRSIMDGSLQDQDSKTSRSLNYYWGMSSDMVGVHFSDLLPRGVRYLGELIQKAIRMGVCRPFYDPKLDENGQMQWHNIKATLSMEEIIAMDWLESNIAGTIPTYEQLPENAKKLVDVMGVGPARKE